ncbi:hypothetical protein Adeg_1375 [Ammonifex degensii KC4]|uniref:Uncharacterized protein n=1 Tax=Ammonifex degensii (strain DSM 10501 / KC4) TaxID=429009 RepID=C9R848_AMMDK|nr:hypothetical protein [Ammonifex degensii]ACX52477.1 hypothetical protein Adeg_1375 [Ammonifex degensii KC4]
MREDVAKRLQALVEAGREKKHIVLSQEDVLFLAKLPGDEYERFKLELYSFALLNSWKILPENRLDALVTRALLESLEKLTARQLTEFVPTAPEGLVLPPGYVVEAGVLLLDPREAFGQTDEGLVRPVAEPAVYLEKFVYTCRGRREVYTATFPKKPRRVELSPAAVEDGKIIPALKNIGVRVFDPVVFLDYVEKSRRLNWDLLSQAEEAEAKEETSALVALLDLLRETILRDKVELRRAVLRTGERVVALWPSDFQRLAKRVGLTEELALQALADAGVLVPSSAREKKRVVAVGTKRARMVVLREGALLPEVEVEAEAEVTPTHPAAGAKASA